MLGCVESNQCVGCFSSLSHFSALARPSWFGRAERNRHRHAIEQASRRWRAGDATIPHRYWEPAKWAQVLRHEIANGDETLVKMDMSAGHFSAADRYRYLRELAFDYAWLLDVFGKAE